MGMRRTLAAMALLAWVSAGCGDDPTGGDTPSLVGSWNLIGFTDGGVAASATGTMVFQPNGTYTMQGQITFPGEPPDAIDTSGNYRQVGDAVELIAGGDTSTWDLQFSGDRVTLTEREPAPANVITLRRD
jgi:hypothetical protein